MDLKTATELCLAPLTATGSHHVQVDRNALSAVLEHDRTTTAELSATCKKLEDTESRLQKTATKLSEMGDELKTAQKQRDAAMEAAATAKEGLAVSV